MTEAHSVMRPAGRLESVLTHEGTSEMPTLVTCHACDGEATFR